VHTEGWKLTTTMMETAGSGVTHPKYSIGFVRYLL